MVDSAKFKKKAFDWLTATTIRGALTNLTNFHMTPEMERKVYDINEWVVYQVSHPRNSPLDPEEEFYGHLTHYYQFQNNFWFDQGYELFLCAWQPYETDEEYNVEYFMKLY